MDAMINGRTPEAIKDKILWCCSAMCCGECKYDADGDFCSSDTVLKDALALIERLEAERDAALAKVPRWISVEERLPEEDGEYLVLKVHNYRKDDGWMAQEVALFLRTRDPEWVIGNLCEVTHWMQLPESPKEK